MSSTNKTTCALAAVAVVALMAGPAFAGAPMNVAQKLAAANAMAQSEAAKAEVAPQTMAQAEAGIEVSDGVTAVEVPEELHNYLTATPDAHGRMRVRDTDSKGSPVATAVEASNEK